jgi:cellulose synthase/poly-beta-1,6-N-acetylglucosamine synthase-like glycosyltransferase
MAEPLVGKMGRYAIVTPYYKEPRDILERCVNSVKAQTLAADHILVADGFPQGWLDDAGVRHLKLDAAHGDYGNFARGQGGAFAAEQAYDAIGFLDADNWLDADHVAACEAAAGESTDIVVARRRLVRLDGSVMDIPEEEGHVDTNCYWLRVRALPLAHHWMTMPKELSALGDRVFFKAVQQRGMNFAHADHQTVNYTCLYQVCYEMLGETPPPEAKPPVDPLPVYRWLTNLNPQERARVAEAAGADMVPDAMSVLFPFDEIDRNAPCPCGSGKKFKHCHGAL